MLRLHYTKVASDGFNKILAVGDYVHNSGLELPFLHIVYLRVSQINGCPYCIDMHWQDASKEGVDARKLNAIAGWRGMPFFSDKEKAALGWAEAVTRLEHQHVAEEPLTELKKYFSEKEIANLTYAIANMNALNRVAMAFDLQPNK